MLPELEPHSRLLVYDLVKQAGLDVSDWANFSGTNPATNPKYCYEWAFWEAGKAVVLSLWFDEMQEHDGTIFRDINIRKYAESLGTGHSEGVRAARALRMDEALRAAAEQKLPVRVIVCDGKRRSHGDDETSVQRRMLDPVPWSVASYNAETGDCRLVRGDGTVSLDTIAGGSAAGAHRLARIAYNSRGWQRPTGEAGDQESEETYNAKNRFGHEDWLFRAEWIIDGWRYAFIQGLNKSRRKYIGQELDVTLFTIEPDRRRRLVATIYDLECLSDEQAKEALEAFRERGWLDTMRKEVEEIGGNVSALGAGQWAEHILNVRFRLEKVDRYPAESFLKDEDWIRDRHRYMLYRFERHDRERVERTTATRKGTQDAPESRQLFRRGTKPVEYTPEHGKMQAKLLAELKVEYGEKCVWLERDFVDARVETPAELIFFEIKTDARPREVIRQALGQVLDYAYHPARSGRRPDRLVIVGRTKLSASDEAYLRDLCERFKLPLSYRVVSID